MPKNKPNRTAAANKTRALWTPFTPAQEKDICTRYTKGSSIAQLAQEWKTHAPRIARILARHKTKTRERGRRPTVYAKDVLAKAKALYLKGGIITAVAKVLDCAAPTAADVLRGLGVKIRTPSERRQLVLKASGITPRKPKAAAKAKPKASKPKASKPKVVKPKPAAKAAKPKASKPKVVKPTAKGSSFMQKAVAEAKAKAAKPVTEAVKPAAPAAPSASTPVATPPAVAEG